MLCDVGDLSATQQLTNRCHLNGELVACDTGPGFPPGIPGNLSLYPKPSESFGADLEALLGADEPDDLIGRHVIVEERTPDGANVQLLLSCGLTEEIKWGKPCYSHDGRNIVILQGMKEFLSLMFFKGALLNDSEAVIEDQGPNPRSARRIRFTSVEDVARLTDTVKACIDEALNVEEAGLDLGPAPDLVFVEELQNRLDQDQAFKAAFEALTPGRQREYNLYFSDAKQTKTREARVEKYAQKILNGKGLRDR